MILKQIHDTTVNHFKRKRIIENSDSPNKELELQVLESETKFRIDSILKQEYPLFDNNRKG